MESRLTVRPYRAGDEPAVVELWRSCGLLRPWNDPHADIARKLRIQPDLFLVGTLMDQPVATVMAGYDGHRGWLNYLGVAPGFRRRSFGRQMVEAAEEALERLGCPKINLQIRTENQQVIDFYRELGYGLDEVVSMGKRLDGAP
jgi:ribosomal protein S18 acetylase RimI-like enzyme